MKKLLAVVLVAVVCCGLIACGKKVDITKLPDNQDISLKVIKSEFFKVQNMSEDDYDGKMILGYKNPKTVKVNDVECNAYYAFYGNESDGELYEILYDAEYTDDNYTSIKKYFDDNYGALKVFNAEDYPEAGFSFEPDIDVRVIETKEGIWAVYMFETDGAVRLSFMKASE